MLAHSSSAQVPLNLSPSLPHQMQCLVSVFKVGATCGSMSVSEIAIIAMLVCV